jgi:hypothetical protein
LGKTRQKRTSLDTKTELERKQVPAETNQLWDESHENRNNNEEHARQWEGTDSLRKKSHAAKAGLIWFVHTSK